MSIHIYKDAELTEQISEGNMTNPDMDTFDGSSGESKDRKLFIANEQTSLATAIDAVQSQITLFSPRFGDGDVIVIGSEQIRIVSGGRTTTPTVQRAIYGTESAAHAQGTKVYSACNYTGLIVESVDTSGTDESSWCALATTQEDLDTAVPGQALVLGDKSFNSTISFWRRIAVPAGTTVQNKTDLRLRLTGTLSLA
jgi:hypothetical protein